MLSLCHPFKLSYLTIPTMNPGRIRDPTRILIRILEEGMAVAVATAATTTTLLSSTRRRRGGPSP